ncbi:iron chelate uptake ABC transporter family permease subunit [Serratia ureilytica]
MFSALTSYLVFSGDQRAAGSVLFWSLGGLGLARWDNLFIPLASFRAAGRVYGAALAGAGRALLAGEQTAHSMGVAWRGCAPRPFCAAHCPRVFSFR